jgi:hypothetical protein
MIDAVKLTSNDKKDWLNTHTLTSEQRQKLITQKLERARAQFNANAKVKALA